jgi:16S rRNA (cytosine1402-N4)-methyltransferase
MIHESVLLHEAIEGLEIQDGDIVIDATLGNGGHSEALLSLRKDIRVIAIDMDIEAIERSKKRLAPLGGNITFVEGNFRNIPAILEKVGVHSVSKILFDFGLSSNQLEESGRGFTFQKNEPLEMTFGKEISSSTLTARDVVNEWQEESLREIIRGFGEERFAGRIARGITEARAQKPIETTDELVDIIKSMVPGFYKKGRIHPATRTFQAIRIAVNDELGAITNGLKYGFEHLLPFGRIAAISFHSLEDRIVKQYFRSLYHEGLTSQITKKPIVPTEMEIKNNPRSRSAKLRIIQKK